MTQQGRPDGHRTAQGAAYDGNTRISPAGDTAADPRSILAADTFGRGLSATQIHAANRAAFRAIAAQPGGWHAYVAGIFRRLWEQAAAEALQTALPSSWLRRAEALEAVGTPSALEDARNCRRHAWLLTSIALDEASAELVACVVGQLEGVA